MSGDEDRILCLVRQRLELGHREYGDLDVHDDRDPVREAVEEALDQTIYLAMKLLRILDYERLR